ncbi:UNVERIFIED_CONTAM: hypothetical protein Scaly_0666700 [Sesamum calycinum]|uniref:Uncharacterized protein n=1 Tax=Sesamum calycinum TaxID=2727403 RepID=A0AAW2RVC0_9LAMI
MIAMLSGMWDFERVYWVFNRSSGFLLLILYLLGHPSISSLCAITTSFTFGCYPKTRVRTSPSFAFQFKSPSPSCQHLFSVAAAVPSSQESVSVHFEDFVEKDWSFLDPDEVNNDGEQTQKIDRIISAGNIKKPQKF